MRAVVRALVALGVLGLLLFTAPAAGAHAVLESSRPADGSSSEAAPSAVELTFDEQVDTATVAFDLRADGGRTTVVTVVPAGASTVVRGVLPPLDHGAYDLRWTATSVDDQHRVTGSIAFGVGTSAVPAGVNAGPPPPLTGVLRQWGLLAVTGAVMAVVAVVVSRRRGVIGWSSSAVDRRFGDVMLVLGLAGCALSLVDVGGGSLTVGPTALAVPGWWLVLVGAVLVGTAGRPHRPVSTTGSSAGLLLLVLGQVVDSHLRGGWGWGLVLGLHLLAATAWTALVATLVVAGRLEHRRAQAGAPSTAARWSAATGPAVGLTVVVVSTGLLLAGRETASLDAVLRSTYGHWLLVKTALLLVAVTLGGAAWWRRRGPTRGTPRGRGELVALTLALGAAAALSLSAPATGPGFAPVQLGQQTPVAEPVADFFLTADLAPDVPGPAVLRVGVNEVRHPGPGAPTAVSAELVGPAGTPSEHHDLQLVDPEHWSSSQLQLDVAGPWRLTLRVVRPGVPDVVWNGSWLVASPVGSAPRIISTAGWSGVLDGAAGVLVIAAALGAVVRRRRSQPSSPPTWSEDPVTTADQVVPTVCTASTTAGVR